MRLFLIIVLSLTATGCQLPQWRLFQAKVPVPVVKTDAQHEIDRKAADYIARTVKEPANLKPIAIGLSESLGHPKDPVKIDDDSDARVLALLNKALLETQERRAELNRSLDKLEGKKIEGTGVNVFGFSMSLGVLGVVVLCVIFPPLGTIIWMLFKRAYGALSRTTEGIGNFIRDHPEAGENLKDYLQGAHDTADREIIKKIKAKL